ncbi:MAG: hypothetical protein HW389_739 [Bacteroidetes bacterium]|nr:hypothetical protein [Bacteroidota bacterium]
MDLLTLMPSYQRDVRLIYGLEPLTGKEKKEIGKGHTLIPVAQ